MPRKRVEPKPESQAAEERGWTSQYLTLPHDLALTFRAESDRFGYGGLKVSGTAAIAAFLALPEQVRDALCLWLVMLRRNPGEVTPEAAYRVMAKAMGAPADILSGESPAVTQWVIDRLLDPEITPPPGEKASDRAGGKGADGGRKAG